MDWTGVTNNPTFNMKSKSLEISGSVSYTTDMTINSPGTSTFITSSTVSLFSGEHRIGNVYVDKNLFNQGITLCQMVIPLKFERDLHITLMIITIRFKGIYRFNNYYHK